MQVYCSRAARASLNYVQSVGTFREMLFWDEGRAVVFELAESLQAYQFECREASLKYKNSFMLKSGQL